MCKKEIQLTGRQWSERVKGSGGGGLKTLTNGQVSERESGNWLQHYSIITAAKRLQKRAHSALLTAETGEREAENNGKKKAEKLSSRSNTCNQLVAQLSRTC